MVAGFTISHIVIRDRRTFVRRFRPTHRQARLATATHIRRTRPRWRFVHVEHRDLNHDRVAGTFVVLHRHLQRIFAQYLMVQQRRRNQLSGARIDIERHLLVPRQRVSQLVPVRVGRKQGFTHRCTQCSVLSNCSRGVAALRECWGGVALLLRARANRRLPDRHVDPAGVRSAALVRNHVGERVGSRETRGGSIRHGCLVAGDRCRTVARCAYR